MVFTFALYQIKTFCFIFGAAHLCFRWVPSQSGKIINVGFYSGISLVISLLLSDVQWIVCFAVSVEGSND